MPNSEPMYASTFAPRRIYRDRFSNYESFRSSISNKQFSARGNFCKLISQNLKGQVYTYGPLLESLHYTIDLRVGDENYLDSRALTRMKELYLDFMNLSKTISEYTIESPVLAKVKLTAKYLFIIMFHRYLKEHYVVGLPDLPKNLKQVYINAIVLITKDGQDVR